MNDVIAQQADDKEVPEGFAPLFNGTDFTGWQGNLDFFRVEEEAIVAGRLTEPIPQPEFLCTTREYGDFELRLQVKNTDRVIEGAFEGRVKGALVVRSKRIPDKSAVRGYLVDTGEVDTKTILSFGGFVSEELARKAGVSDQPYMKIWGALIDESRRGKMLGLGSQEELAEVVKLTDWNDLMVRCEGARIQVWVNGFRTVDYTEPDDTIVRTGIIGLKLHGGAPKEYYYRNIIIKELPKPQDREAALRPDQALSILKL
jgi:hypothetical protein